MPNKNDNIDTWEEWPARLAADLANWKERAAQDRLRIRRSAPKADLLA